MTDLGAQYCAGRRTDRPGKHAPWISASKLFQSIGA